MIPDISTIWVVFFLLLCTWLLNTLIFQPILRVIDARAAAVKDARDLADTAASRAADATARYDTEVAAARAEVYGQIDTTRKAALDRRAEMLTETRALVERETKEATAAVARDSAAAREALERDAHDMSRAIVTRVLGRAS
ncbi:MAG: ATP synthase F0 subunit B [Acidobacteria bacterium]|nr:ATP synthase F0 subunit B [Acidobacteriota bacterium]